jgi:hypothetical protein
MEFLAGRTYRNVSGAFEVMSVGKETLKLKYATGPQVGRVLIKRIADMAQLKTSEIDAAPSDKPKRKGSGGSPGPGPV